MRLAAAFLGVAKGAPTRLHDVELFWCVASVALVPEPLPGQGVGSSGVGFRHLGFLFFVSATADFDKPLKLRIHRVRRAAWQGQGVRHRHICASCSTKDYRRREWGAVCSELEWKSCCARRQCSSHVTVHRNYLGILLKCRVKFSGSGVGDEILRL